MPGLHIGDNDLFPSFNQKKASEVIKKSNGYRRIVILGPPRSGKSFFTEKYLRDSLPDLIIDEYTVGVVDSAKAESSTISEFFNKKMPSLVKPMDMKEVEDEELKRLLGNRAPKHIVEDTMKQIGDSAYMVYFIPWGETESCVEDPSKCGISEDVMSALRFIIDAFGNKKIKWLNAEYIPPGLVNDVLELIKSKGGDKNKGLEEAKEGLTGWVSAYFEALKILGIYDEVGRKSSLVNYTINAVEVIKELLPAPQYIVAGIALGPVAGGLVVMLTRMLFKRDKSNYIDEMLKLRESLKKLCKPSSDNCNEFNELGELIVYKVALATGIKHDDVKDALKYIIGLTEEQLRKQVEDIEKRIEKVENELRYVKEQVKDSLVGVKIYFINDVEDGLLYDNFVVKDNFAKIKTIIGTAGEEFETDLVDAGKFNDVAKNVFSMLVKNGRVVLVGPKGVGKSTLATYVAWRALLGRLGDVDAHVDALIRVDKLEPGKASSIENILNKADDWRFLAIYDPFPIESYIKPETMQINYTLEEIKVTIKELMEVKNMLVMMVLPSDIYELVKNGMEGDEEFKSSLKAVEDSRVLVDIRDYDFLLGVIKSYSGCQAVPEELAKIVKDRYSDGYTLVAKYAGMWLHARGCEAKDVGEALRVNEPKLFFAHYIWGAVMRKSENLAKRISIPLMLHAAYGPIPEGITYMTKAVNVGVWKLLDKDSLKNTQLTDLREEDLVPIAKWLSIKHEELVEDTLKELAGLRGKNEKVKYVNNGLKSLVDALDWGYEKVLNELKTYMKVKQKKVKKNLMFFVGDRLKLVLNSFSNNCWRRAALIIGYGLAYPYPLLWFGNLPKDIEYPNDTLKPCSVDDYLLVDNKIPPLIEELILGRGFGLTNLAEAFVDKYNEAIGEIKNVLNNPRNRGGIAFAEAYYGLGLASIVAYGVKLGQYISSDDADAVLRISLSSFKDAPERFILQAHEGSLLDFVQNSVQKIVLLFLSLIEAFIPSRRFLPILRTLEPLHNKAPHRYLQLLNYVSTVVLDRDTARLVFEKLNDILDKHRDDVKKQAWPIVHAVFAYKNLFFLYYYYYKIFEKFNYMYFEEKEVREMVIRIAELLKELDDSNLGIIGWADVLSWALKNDDARKLMERVFLEKGLQIDLVKKAEEVLEKLNKLTENAVKLQEDKVFMNYIMSLYNKADYKEVNDLIQTLSSDLNRALAN